MNNIDLVGAMDTVRLWQGQLDFHMTERFAAQMRGDVPCFHKHNEKALRASVKLNAAKSRLVDTVLTLSDGYDLNFVPKNAGVKS